MGKSLAEHASLLSVNQAFQVRLLYEVSSPGAGTDRSHAAGCRYSVCTSCIRPC